jgi:DUF1365 family protein
VERVKIALNNGTALDRLHALQSIGDVQGEITSICKVLTLLCLDSVLGIHFNTVQIYYSNDSHFSSLPVNWYFLLESKCDRSDGVPLGVSP